jgi:hypothetical protein
MSVIINGQSNIPINQTKAVKERIGKLQRARSKEREKTSAEVFRECLICSLCVLPTFLLRHVSIECIICINISPAKFSISNK